MADNRYIVRVDGVKWLMTMSVKNTRLALPLCPDDDIQLDPYVDSKKYDTSRGWRARYSTEALKLKCEQCGRTYDIPREYSDEQTYVIRRVDAKIYKGMRILDLDGELTPVAKEKVKDDTHFVTAQIMNSKRGKQIVVYAGENGSKEKTQIFVDPETKKVSFDHKDLSPTDVFAKIEVEFKDGSRHTIEAEKKKKG